MQLLQTEVHIVKKMCFVDAYQEACLDTRIPFYTNVRDDFSKANILEGNVKNLCILYSRTTFCGNEGKTTETKCVQVRPHLKKSPTVSSTLV